MRLPSLGLWVLRRGESRLGFLVFDVPPLLGKKSSDQLQPSGAILPSLRVAAGAPLNSAFTP
jgi:hypothetical protein